MANTKTNTRLVVGKSKVIQYFTLVYVDTATESNVVIYDSSAVATAIQVQDPTWTDPADSKIMEVHAIVMSASTARVNLMFKATTDVVAVGLPSNVDIHEKPKKGCVWNNYAGAGKTGNIVLNATGLAAGDVIMVELHVRPH